MRKIRLHGSQCLLQDLQCARLSHLQYVFPLRMPFFPPHSYLYCHGYVFTYIYEKNSYFQYYTALYKVTDKGVKNEILQELAALIEEGKATGDVRVETDSYMAAQNVWLLMTGIGTILATNIDYRYQEGLDTLLYGIEAISSYMRK